MPHPDLAVVTGAFSYKCDCHANQPNANRVQVL